MRVAWIALLLVAATGCGQAARDAQEEAISLAEVFLIGLRDGRWQTAYNRLDPRLQEACGGPNEMAEQVIGLFEARLSDWTLEVRSVYRTSVILDGTAQHQEREPVSIGLVMEGAGGQWRIEAFEVEGRELCAPSPEAEPNSNRP